MTRTMKKINPFFRCFLKNMGNIHNLCPSFIPITVLYTLANRAQPFITMILGARIVDMLVTGADRDAILTLAFVMVGSQMLIELIHGAMLRLMEMCWQLVAHRKDRDIGYKAMNMDYDILERNSTLELIAQANGNADKMGGWVSM